MRVEQLGDGEPEVAIVGSVHGDEPCGARAIERLLDADLDVLEPVKLVVANERALEAGVRYLDADLNRSFGEDVPEDAHEVELARRLADEIRGCTVLSIHSTQSHADPFAITAGFDGPVPDVVTRLPVVATVDTHGFGEGRLFVSDADIVEVEAGLQGTETAAENAFRLARAFLTAVDVLPGSAVEREIPVFEMGEAIPKPPADEYEVFVENFERVERGETFAAADGEKLVADDPFWPVLLSPYGYAGQFGYRGQHRGTAGQSSDDANSTSVSSLSSAQ
ncbi:succinylglutamate desuccinylase/aspartoacylase family protein [Halobacterium sp. R2-5]|uniref:succinylglutamate desuccinylase/aspartoacylase domain-containing protein n=1 Tax=Halobacterium sp. R2-5 TaxID=2715751 RepID=UPI0014247B85|nr:succinylglutamate desuccinylase/aspartoacylase family protein [Halobacterium sp. R2-5]NIC00527.1 succinylglutamate desuccinylase [Halobacterium sp. R2-5]